MFADRKKPARASASQGGAPSPGTPNDLVNRADDGARLLEAVPGAWRQHIEARVPAPVVTALETFLRAERAQGSVFPPPHEVFTALERTPLERVKVVLLGQDPYHGEGEAHGLSFSVKPGVKVPPSLRNIFTELESDFGAPRPPHGILERWADEGVLLLNTCLTVRANAAGSHRRRGWEQVTDALLQAVNERAERVVFVLLGKDAQKKAPLVSVPRHAVISAPHPSPLSAHAGFFGSRIFSRANDALRAAGIPPVDWSL